RVAGRGPRFHIQREWTGQALHRVVAESVSASRPSPPHSAALKSDLGKFVHVKEFRAAQMIVPLFDARVDAAHLDLCRDGGILRMLAVDLDLAAELREFSMGGAEELVHGESDRRSGRIELVRLVRPCAGTQAGDYGCSDKIA